ncbi:hypothetical protein Trydic_g19049 [Trypoxylus dichotomus]
MQSPHKRSQYGCETARNNLEIRTKVTLSFSDRSNVKADELAQVSLLADKGPRHSVGMAYMVVKETTKEWKDKMSLDWWNSIPGQRQAKKSLVGYRSTFRANLLSRDRKPVRKIVELLTGHCLLKKHMSNLGLTEKTVLPGRKGDDRPRAA